MSSFGVQLLDLPAIFKGNLFTIPDYQRGYAWDKKQVEELLQDIEHLIDDGLTLRHYTGTLVLSRSNVPGNKEFHVVDGQQRLTTLVILLCLLYKHLPLGQQAGFTSTYLHRGDLGSGRSVLRLNSDTRTFFERVILADGGTDGSPITLEAHRRLLDARQVMAKWLEDKISAGVELASLRKAVEARLGFIVYAPQDSAETGVMFEVINTRGKPLSELEKVKNYLIYCCVKLAATSLRTSIDKDWSDILTALNVAQKTSSGDEGAFLRYSLVVHFKLNKTDSQYGYEELKKLIRLDESLNSADSKQRTVKQISDFVTFMKTASIWYKRLYGRDHSALEPGVVTLLDQIRAQGRHASIMPLFLAIVIKLKGHGDRLQKLLRLLELLNFRVYMARNMTARNDTGQGELYGLAADYYHDTLLEKVPSDERKPGRESVETEEDALEFRLLGFVAWYASDQRFIDSFALAPENRDDFYKWRGLRYFLMNYEAKLQPKKTIQIDKILLGVKDGKTADYLSVEHLWATQNRCLEGENNRKRDGYQRRRLGNFVLLELRLNIQGCNDDLAEKLPRYLDGFGKEPPTDLQQVRRMARDAKAAVAALKDRQRRINFYHDLHRDINDRQEKRYTDFAESRWSLKGYLGYGKILTDSVEQAIDDY